MKKYFSLMRCSRIVSDTQNAFKFLTKTATYMIYPRHQMCNSHYGSLQQLSYLSNCTLWLQLFLCFSSYLRSGNHKRERVLLALGWKPSWCLLSMSTPFRITHCLLVSFYASVRLNLLINISDSSIRDYQMIIRT